MSGALERATRAIGDRWSLLLVAALMEGPRRFGELQSAIPGLAPNILTARLRHLERQGVVVGRPYSRRPLRVDYVLTGRGAELAGAIRLLAAWEAAASGSTEGDEEGHPRHGACGTPMELRWWCPTCARNAAEGGGPDAGSPHTGSLDRGGLDRGGLDPEGIGTDEEDYWL